MRRIATIGAVAAAFAVAPSLASGGTFAVELEPQVSAQVIGAQVASAQVARSQRAQAAVSVQRHLVQLKLARHLGALRPLIR